MSDPHVDEHAIAIVGMAGRFPGARDLDTFWRNLRDGIESITFFSDEELEELGVDPRVLASDRFVRAAPVIEDADLFDAAFFGYSPREAALLDPQQRLFLELSWRALEDAGYDPSTYAGLVGVFGGMSMSSYLLFNLLPNRNLDPLRDSFQLMIGSDKDFLATRVSYHLGLQGPSMDIQTGCSTSLVALHLAAESLISYQCDMALAGGVSIQVPQRWGYFYEEGGINSPDGHCRAFDARAQGTLFGSGAGLVVLKRLSDALEDGDRIEAVVRSSAVNNDGSMKIGFTAPGADGQAEVIHRAHAIAEIDPESISYVETHGTGTALGDPVEVNALRKAFDTDRRGFCGLGSVKTNIGHLDAAAGVAGLLKTVLALKHGQLPPSLHFEEPNPEIDFDDSPFYVVSELRDWPAHAEPRRAGVSSFGIGGTNAHVVLEEPPRTKPSDPSRPRQVMVLSARSEDALNAATDHLATHLRDLSVGDDPEPDDVAFVLQAGRKRFPARRAVVTRSLEDAAKALETRDPERVWSAWDDQEERPVVFLFPGGGAQYPDMGAGLYERETVFRQEVDRAADLLHGHLGYDLRDLLYPAPERVEEAGQRMLRTSVALPALFAVEHALARQWMAWGVRPAAMIGHSLGEYAAGCLAGVFDLEDALTLVVARGRLFERLPEGGMVSLPLPEPEVRRLMEQVDSSLDMAAVNGPAQCVVSGPVEAVDAFVERLEREDVEHRRVQIEVAAHSKTVQPILEEFERVVRRIDFEAPRVPFVSNVTGTWITPGEATNPGYWVRHLRQTVRFGDGLEALREDLEPILLEVGPGRTLATLAQLSAGPEERRRIFPSLRHPYDQIDDHEFLLGAVARLWLHGARIDWQAFHGESRRRRVALPTYPFERKRYWVDPPAPDQRHRPDAEKTPDVDRWLYLPSLSPAPPVRPWSTGDSEALGGSILVLHDGDALAGAILRRLGEGGLDVIEVRPGRTLRRRPEGGYDIDPTEAASWTEVLTDLDRARRSPKRILHLWSRGLEADDAPSLADRFAALQGSGYESLLALVQALGEYEEPVSVWTVTDGVAAVQPDEPLEPARATLLGPSTVAPQEHDHLRCQLVDVGKLSSDDEKSVEVAADQVLAEMREDLEREAPGPRIVALRGRRRWEESYLPFDPTPETAVRRRLRSGGVYLLTGGLGDVGLHVARHLAMSYGAKLVLLSRSGTPPRECWDEEIDQRDPGDPIARRLQALREIEAVGGEVMTVAADVTDRPRLAEAIDQAVERFDRLDGVIHLAGYSGEETVKLLPQIDAAESALHFDAKVYGTLALAEVLGDRSLDFCLLFSSNVTVLGGIGATAYAASNAFLEAWVEARAEGETPWIAATWDGWLTGEAERVASVATTLDRYAMTPRESLQVFERVVERAPAGRVVVSTGDLEARRDTWLRGLDDPAEDVWGEAIEAQPRPDLSTPFAPPTNELEETVARVWSEVLGVAELGIDDNFFDLGGNSLLGLKVINGLRKELGVDVPVVRLFEGPTVRAFTELLEDETDEAALVAESESRGARRRARRERRTAVLEEVGE